MYPSVTNGESSQGWAIGPRNAFGILCPKPASSSLGHPLSPSLKVFEFWGSVLIKKAILSSPSIRHALLSRLAADAHIRTT